MKRILFVLLLLAPRLLFAQAQTISGFTVATNGWSIFWTMPTAAVSGTYNFNLTSTNTFAGTPQLSVTGTTIGYDDSGNLISVTNKVYGTHVLRQPFPNQANNAEISTGGNFTTTNSLSGFWFQGDSNLLATAVTGLYVKSGVSNATATAITVTNTSTAQYPKVIANNAWPNATQVTSNNLRCRMIGFHRSAQDGRPLRLVIFTVRDQHSNTNTGTAKYMLMDNSLTIPSPRYFADVDISAMTNGDLLTVTWKAYPWKQGVVLDSNDGANVQPTPLYAAQTYLCNRTGGFKGAVAMVDPTNGVDATGVAFAPPYTGVEVKNMFKTMSIAAHAVAGTNLALFGHNDTAGSELRLTNGYYVQAGNSSTYGTNGVTYLRITPCTNVAASAVIITNEHNGNDTFFGDKMMFDGLTISNGAPQFFINGGNYLWVNNCILKCAGGAATFTTPICYATYNTVLACDQGFRPSSTRNIAFALIVGNNFNGVDDNFNSCAIYTCMDNVKTQVDADTSSLFGFTDETSPSQTAPIADGWIMFNNRILGQRNPNGAYVDMATSITSISNAFGGAFVQNVFECCANVQTLSTRIVGDGSLCNPVNNIIAWHNTIAGGRCNWSYNDSGTSSMERHCWSVMNNYFDDWNIKTDTFGTQSGNRTGNWSQIYGVDFSGNVFAEINGVGASGSFFPEFSGLSTPTTTQNNPQAIGWPKFANPLSYLGLDNDRNLGGGDYRWQRTSPALGVAATWVLPYDIEGNVRSTNDCAGAYAFNSRIHNVRIGRTGGFH